MSLEVWIAGLPSHQHGAGTELDNLIDLFREHEVAVHLAPVDNRVDPAVANDLIRRGCHVHEYHPQLFADKVVLSFVERTFLAHLSDIARRGRPAKVIWFNCGLRPMPGELEAHAAGLIDVHGFVSRYQRSRLMPALEAMGCVRTFDYRPYLNLKRIEWRYRDWNGVYVLGRISRDDPRKYSRDTWRIFERVQVPPGLAKEVNILGFSLRAATKTGPPPRSLRLRLWRQGEISPGEFFRTIDTLVYKTGGTGESYGRVILEACAHGVVPVVENAYAFPELIVHGATGYLAADSQELIHYAGLLAANPGVHFEMSRDARAHVERVMDPEQCWQPWLEQLQT
jgi:hypothetical protein